MAAIIEITSVQLAPAPPGQPHRSLTYDFTLHFDQTGIAGFDLKVAIEASDMTAALAQLPILLQNMADTIKARLQNGPL